MIEFILEDHDVDEGFLHYFEILSVLKGNLDPTFQYVQEVAYKNLDYKLSLIEDPNVAKVIKTQQLGVQYLVYLLELGKQKQKLY